MADVAGPILDLECLPCLPCRCNCCLMLAACRSRGAFPGGARSWLMWNGASKCEKLSHEAAATLCIVPPLSASSQFAVGSNQNPLSQMIGHDTAIAVVDAGRELARCSQYSPKIHASVAG